MPSDQRERFQHLEGAIEVARQLPVAVERIDAAGLPSKRNGPVASKRRTGSKPPSSPLFLMS